MILPDLRPSKVCLGQRLAGGQWSTGTGHSEAEASSYLAPSMATSHSRSSRGVGCSQTPLSAPPTTGPTALAAPVAIHRSGTQQEAVEKHSPAKRSNLSLFLNPGHLGATRLCIQSSPLLETLRWASGPAVQPQSLYLLQQQQRGLQPLGAEREKYENHAPSLLDFQPISFPYLTINAH